MLGISGGDPAFRDDDGSADASVTEALSAFAAGAGSETAALAALAAGRLLVPVVAVLAEELGAVPAGHQGQRPPATEAGSGPAGGEKASEMAMPTLIGLDGRRAIAAFTCLDSMYRWQSAARPVPVAALTVWQAALADSCAVVIDVAGPVPIAVEGARLAALGRGEPAPAPYLDPDVREIVADVLAGQLDVAAFELRPASDDCDLVIALTSAAGGGRDGTEMATEVGNAVMARLGARLRRGVAIWLGA